MLKHQFLCFMMKKIVVKWKHILDFDEEDLVTVVVLLDLCTYKVHNCLAKFFKIHVKFDKIHFYFWKYVPIIVTYNKVF